MSLQPSSSDVAATCNGAKPKKPLPPPRSPKPKRQEAVRDRPTSPRQECTQNAAENEAKSPIESSTPESPVADSNCVDHSAASLKPVSSKEKLTREAQDTIKPLPTSKAAISGHHVTAGPKRDRPASCSAAGVGLVTELGTLGENMSAGLKKGGNGNKGARNASSSSAAEDVSGRATGGAEGTSGRDFSTQGFTRSRGGSQEEGFPSHQDRMGRLRRSRSMYGVHPSNKFGPKGSVQKCSVDSMLMIQDPGSLRLEWFKAPMTILVIKKIRDDSVIPPFKDLVSWLVETHRMVVYVQSSTLQEELVAKDHDFDRIKTKLISFDADKEDLTNKIDFIICLGGDGTLLYASSLFQTSMPPVMAFHMGSLGFLTNFLFEDYQAALTKAFKGNTPLTLRTRLKCVTDLPSEETPKLQYLVMNEVVIDRGPTAFLCQIDVYVEGMLVTCVMGDGLIISTPTGSTAYAAAAGASMIHPNVPAIVICPICPHSLSFRPIVLPAGAEITVKLAQGARNPVYASFDGKNRVKVDQGASITITTSQHPIPSLCLEDQVTDWFSSLAECLHWNVRKQQKKLDDKKDDA